MELIDLVSDLLYKHNCVIIPDFGGFVANFKSAEFEENRLLLSPSRKKVAFNQSLIENDGLLINALLKKKEISYEQAEKEVNLFSKFLKDRLLTYKNYEFKHIGSFYLNKEDRMVFVAYEGLNFYKKSFGLQDVKIKRLSNVLANKAIPITPEEREVVEIRAIPVKAMRRWIHLPQIAASLAIVAIIGFVLWQLLGNDNHGNQQASAVMQSELMADSPQQASFVPELNTSEYAESANKPDITPEIKEVTDDLINAGKLPNPENREIVSNIEPQHSVQANDEKPDLDAMYQKIMAPEPMYYVAVARYGNTGASKTLDAEMRKKEYAPFEVFEDNGGIHLCLEKFRSAKLANDYLYIVKKYDYKKAYIFQKND